MGTAQPKVPLNDESQAAGAVDPASAAALRRRHQLALISTGVTAPFRRTALRERREVPPPVARELPAAASPADPAPAIAGESQRSKIVMQPVLLAAIATLIAAGAMWWVMSLRVPDIDPREVMAKNLAAAQLAIDDGRLIEPAERSALHYFRTVLALDPANSNAQRGMDDIADRLIADARVMIVEGRFADATLALDNVRRLRPSHRKLPLLDAELRRQLQERLLLHAQEAANFEPLRPEVSATSAPKSPAPVAQPDTEQKTVATLRSPIEQQRETQYELLHLVLQRSQANALLEPAGDSAKHYLDKLIQIDRKFTGVAQGIDALGGRLVASAQIAIFRKDPAQAQKLLSQARAIGFVGAETEAAEAALQTLRTSVQVPPALAAIPAPAAIHERTLVRYVAPEYPHAALVRGLEGWIDVILTVSAAGDVTAQHVAGGLRRGTFEQAALAAVRQWKYEPRTRDDPNVTQNIRALVRFELRD